MISIVLTNSFNTCRDNKYLLYLPPKSIAMRNIIYLLFICFFFCSCKTKYITTEVPIETIKTEYKVNNVYDSIYVHDSTFVMIKGDTIIKEVVRIKDRLKSKIDTIMIHDSIDKPIYIKSTEVVTENKLNTPQKVLIYSGLILWIIIIGYIIKKVKKL